MKKMKLVNILVTFGMNIQRKVKEYFKNLILKVKAFVKTKILLYKLNRKMHKVSLSFQFLTPSITQATEELNNLAKCFDNIKEEQDTKQIIAVDFDGTLCEDCWPEIGSMNIELILWLIWRQKHGSIIILWTCREGARLNQAVQKCKELGLTFDSVNEQCTTIGQKYGFRSRKVYADVYIDDHNSTTYWKLPFHPMNNK